MNTKFLRKSTSFLPPSTPVQFEQTPLSLLAAKPESSHTVGISPTTKLLSRALAHQQDCAEHYKNDNLVRCTSKHPYAPSAKRCNTAYKPAQPHILPWLPHQIIRKGLYLGQGPALPYYIPSLAARQAYLHTATRTVYNPEKISPLSFQIPRASN